MANQKEDHPETSIFRSSLSDSDDATVSSGGRREPGFGRFQDSSVEEYEEPERDTDYFSGYSADEEHLEEEQDDLFPQRDDESPAAVSSGGSWSSHRASGTVPAVEEESEDAEEWQDDEDDYDVEEEREPAMPLRLIAVAVLAVLLLTVGAYGVLQERASMQDELRELRASLATGAKASDLVDAREALRGLQAAYNTLEAQSASLAQENEQLREAVAELEAEQAEAPAAEEPVVETAAAKPVAVAAPVEKAPEEAPAAPAAPPAEPAPAATGEPGNWFVNFGSYTSPDTAQGWAAKLRPVQGEVVVVPGTKDDRTYYRVRVIGLSGKSAAELVARQLEAEMQVSRLWVGQE